MMDVGDVQSFDKTLLYAKTKEIFDYFAFWGAENEQQV